MTENMEVTDTIINELLPEIDPVTSPEGVELDEHVFTNDKTNPAIRHLYRMFYQSVFENRIGLMHAKAKDSDKVHTIIVGVHQIDDGTYATWPIAKVLTEEEQNTYAAPDGNGNFVE